MKTIGHFLSTLGAVATLCVSSASADNSALQSGDKSFVQDAYLDGLAEVQLAQLAERKTGNADVKSFAEQLVNDHTASNNELKALAEAKKISLATEPSMVAMGKSKLLDMKSGVDFDKAFIAGQVSDHKKDIADFEKAMGNAGDADVKALASKFLLALKSHLSTAEGLQQKVGK